MKKTISAVVPSSTSTVFDKALKMASSSDTTKATSESESTWKEEFGFRK